MNEIGKYGVLKEKLQGICNEHDLIFNIHNQGYPFRMTIKPAGGMESQQTMMEGMDGPGETGYISPDASLVFVYKDGNLSYKISETWTISETLFSKLKNLFKKMHALWMQYFFRDIHEHNPSMVNRPDDTEQTPADNESGPVDNENEGFDTDEGGDDADVTDIDAGDIDFPGDEVDPFDEFMGDAADAVSEDTEGEE